MAAAGRGAPQALLHRGVDEQGQVGPPGVAVDGGQGREAGQRTEQLAGGYSTAKSLGLGVSGSRRLVDEFSIDSTMGEGTVVTFTKWKRF